MSLTTPRLTIKRLTMQDFDRYYRLISDPRVAEGAGFNLLSNRQMLMEVAKRQIEDPGSLGVYRQEKLIGAILVFPTVGATGMPDQKRLEMSYFLDPTVWHQGLMSEAVRGVVKELLNHHKVVIAEAFVDNAASIALLKKVNFKRVGQTKDPIVGREKLIFTAM